MAGSKQILLGMLPLVLLAGCGGPSTNGRENRKAFEMLLTAISLKNPKEVDKDSKLIEDRHTSGALSDARHGDLLVIIAKARAGDWVEAERMAYEFREAHPYFE